MAAHSPKKCIPAETTHFQRKRTQTRVCAYRCAARSLVKTDTSSYFEESATIQIATETASSLDTVSNFYALAYAAACLKL